MQTMAEVDLGTAIDLIPSLLEQLGKALSELEAHKGTFDGKVSFSDISDYFCGLEAKIRKKYSELEAKEKAFKQEESDGLLLLAAKEESVSAKEQDMYDRIQVLKDAAVAAIVEARANHPLPPFESYDVVDDTENKVRCSFGETDVPLMDPKEGSRDNAGGVDEVMLCQELSKFCEQMDTRGLLSFIVENRNKITSMNEKLSLALEGSTVPGQLVLGSLGEFYPPDTQDGDNKHSDSLQGIRQSCLNLMEAMSTLLARANTGADYLLNNEIRQQAKAIAHEWRPKLAQIDAADGKSLEAQAFLQLLATFKIASEFDEEELCRLALAVAEQRQAPELCRSLGLTHKMPGVIEELINKGKLIGAVHFVHAFDLTDRYPTVPLLKTYLRDMRRSTQGKRGERNSAAAQKENNKKELAAIRALIQCVKKYNLEADYGPLDGLYRRVGQLDGSKSDSRKRFLERFLDPSTKPHHGKKPRPWRGLLHKYSNSATSAAAPVDITKRPAPVDITRRPAPVDITSRPAPAAPPPAYTGSTERYPYNFQAAAAPLGPAAFGQQRYDRMPYHYPLSSSASAVAAAAAAPAPVPAPAPPPPAYSAYASSGLLSSYRLYR